MIHRLLPAACGFALLAAILAFSATADDPAAPVAAPAPSLYDRAMPAVVEILVNDHLNGSGWIADREGFVITAAHVVIGDNRRLEVLMPNQDRLTASLVAMDLGRDLALLRIPPREGGYPFLRSAAKMPAAGADIFLFGAPIYRHGVMLKGAVARASVTFEYLANQRMYIETIHVAANTPRGTSGGPWLNEAGEVVGLQSGMMRDPTDQNFQVGIAFVIPIEFITALLKAKVSTTTSTIGAPIEEVWEQSWDFLKRIPAKTEGIVVRNPEAEGPAARAGLMDRDIILAVNDEPVRFRDHFLKIIRTARPGQELTIKYIRTSGPPRTAKLTLGSMEKN